MNREVSASHREGWWEFQPIQGRNDPALPIATHATLQKDKK